jgi:hypothetical protein
MDTNWHEFEMRGGGVGRRRGDEGWRGGNCDYDYWWSYEGEGGTPWEHRLEACATLGGRAVSVIKIGI